MLDLKDGEVLDWEIEGGACGWIEPTLTPSFIIVTMAIAI